MEKLCGVMHSGENIKVNFNSLKNTVDVCSFTYSAFPFLF